MTMQNTGDDIIHYLDRSGQELFHRATMMMRRENAFHLGWLCENGQREEDGLQFRRLYDTRRCKLLVRIRIGCHTRSISNLQLFLFLETLHRQRIRRERPYELLQLDERHFDVLVVQLALLLLLLRQGRLLCGLWLRWSRSGRCRMSRCRVIGMCSAG